MLVTLMLSTEGFAALYLLLTFSIAKKHYRRGALTREKAVELARSGTLVLSCTSAALVLAALPLYLFGRNHDPFAGWLETTNPIVTAIALCVAVGGFLFAGVMFKRTSGVLNGIERPPGV
jgi:hypothetical protein